MTKGKRRKRRKGDKQRKRATERQDTDETDETDATDDERIERFQRGREKERARRESEKMPEFFEEREVAVWGPKRRGDEVYLERSPICLCFASKCICAIKWLCLIPRAVRF
jgi:hypothetical protein